MSNFIKYYLERVEIHGAVFAIYADGENMKVHILDLDEEGARSVTNCASMAFMAELESEIFVKHALAVELQDCDAILYGSEGVICEYSAEADEFSFLQPTDPHLYEPFKNVCAKRFDENFDNIFK